MKCKIAWCDSTDLVYSGVDALVLGGVPTETYCIECSKIYTIIKMDLEERVGA